MAWGLTGNALYEPLSLRTAATNNLIAQTNDGAFAPGSPGLSAGFLYVCQAYVDQSIAANNAYICQLTAGTSCANSFLGVYDPATGNRLAQTADISTALNATQTAPIEAALTSQLAAQVLNKELWLVVLIGSTSGTPSFVGRSPYAANLGLSSHYRFQLSTSGGLTSLPSTMPALTPFSVSSVTQSQPYLAIGP